jgi:hypothetical protein
VASFLPVHIYTLLETQFKFTSFWKGINVDIVKKLLMRESNVHKATRNGDISLFFLLDEKLTKLVNIHRIKIN